MLNIFISYTILYLHISKKKKKVKKNQNHLNKTSFLPPILALTATVNEKPRQRATGISTTSTDNPTLPPIDDVQSEDTRRFICPDGKWKLQPTLKLLTAYGNEVEPFGADYVLQKLGFRHARLTIPKWVQRGIMDPCEKSMTVVQIILIFLLPERFKQMCMK
jgi:hypothetical protein